MSHTPLAGVYAAALTPLHPDLTPDLDGLLSLLDFLAQRGCHGALLLGTTGEGPSFSVDERTSIFRAAPKIRETHPGFRLLAGTGTPSLAETTRLTRLAFELGFDAALVLPPYYFRNATEDGLFAWFSAVLERAVPEGGALLGYHIPPVTGVPLTPALLARLKDAYPEKFAGLKDSSADLAQAQTLGERFGADLAILNGTDRLLSAALQAGAAGCITALANLISPALRAVWDAHQGGRPAPGEQAALDAARAVSERYPPAAALLKALIAHFHGFPRWPVKPPLLPLAPETEARALLAWQTRGQIA